MVRPVACLLHVMKVSAGLPSTRETGSIRNLPFALLVVALRMGATARRLDTSSRLWGVSKTGLRGTSEGSTSVFICDECLKNWTASPSPFKGGGRCEMCEKPAICNDIPSSRLFLKPSYVATLSEKDAAKARAWGIVDTVESR